MAAVLSLSALALVTAGWAHALRRERSLMAEMAALTDQVRDLTARLEAAEADLARAVTQAEIAESLLLEKGIADEEDIEAARRRLDSEPPTASGYVRGRDGDLH